MPLTDTVELAREMQDRAPYLPGGASSMQRFLQSGFNVNALRNNATLRKQEWEQLDTAVVTEAEQNMPGMGDLLGRPELIHPLRNIGVTISQYEKVTAMDRARVAMSVRTQGDMDSVTWDLASVPVPVFYQEFDVDLRHLEASRLMGTPLDTAKAQAATRVVTEELERALFSGVASIVVGGNTVYGYLTHPDRNTIAGSTWNTTTNIYPSVVNMIGALFADRMRGPYMLYVSDTQYIQTLTQEGVDKFSNIRTRVLELPGLQGMKPTFALPAGTAVLVELNKLVVDVAVAQNIATVQWEERGGWVVKFIVFAVMAPRVKSDVALRSGVVVTTGL